MQEWDEFEPEFDDYTDGYNWLMGEQYTESQKSYYEAQRRPINVWNLIFPIFNRVLGEYLINQIRERIYAKSGGDPNTAGILQDICDTISINTGYKDEFGMTILSGLIKRGIVYPRFSSEKQIDGSILITNVDEFEIMFDSRSIDYFCDDAQYMIRSRWLTVDQIYALWPEHKGKLKEIVKDREQSAYWEAQDEVSETYLSHHNFADERNGKYRVVEFQDREYDKSAEIAYDPVYNQSQIITLEGRRRELFLKANPQMKIVTTNSAEIITTTMCIPGLQFFLDKKNNQIQDKQFDYILFSAYNYGKQTIKNYGMFKNAMGPQKDFNDQRNRMQDIVNKSANSQTAMKPGHITNYQEIKDHGSEPGLIIEIEEEAKMEEVIKRFEPPRNPFANQQLSESAQMLIDRIIGVTENLKGQTQTAQENASLFMQRVREASKSFAPVERNIKRASCRVWNRVIKLIQANYTNETIFPTLNKRGDETEVAINVQIGDRIINDINTGEYYVFPSSDEKNPTIRAMKFMERTELIRMVAELWGPLAVDVRFWLEDAPVQDIEKLIERIEQVQMSMGQDIQEQAAANQMAQLQQLAGTQMQLESEPEPTNNQNKGGKQPVKKSSK